jgi:hypothetical protein
MKIKLLIFIIFTVLILFYCVWNSPNEISDWNRRRIETGELKPLVELKIIDKEKFKIALEYMPENTELYDYYFSASIMIILDERTRRTLSLDYYYENINDFMGFEVEYIEYGFWYYQLLFNRNSGFMGDPTRRCFSLHFNENHEFIRRVFWR